MCTTQGVVKKSNLREYDSNRRDGLIAINLDADDALVGVKLTDGGEEILLSTANGAAIRFDEEDVRPMGRATRGVRGITLEEGDSVVSIDTAQDLDELLVLSENGYGKRTPVKNFRKTKRGGKGVYAIRCNDKTGPLVAIQVVRPGDEMMIITKDGIIIRINVDDISEQGRYASGVRVIKLTEGDAVVDMAKVMSKEDEEE